MVARYITIAMSYNAEAAQQVAEYARDVAMMTVVEQHELEPNDSFAKISTVKDALKARVTHLELANAQLRGALDECCDALQRFVDQIRLPQTRPITDAADEQLKLWRSIARKGPPR